MCTDGRRVCGLLAVCFCASGWGCIGLAGVDAAAVTSLFGEGILEGGHGGNVVVSYTNRTNRMAVWTVMWESPDRDQPTTLTARTGPNETSSIQLEGTVERIALGSMDNVAAAVVLKSGTGEARRVRGPAKPLVCGEDFQAGDIISFTVVESGSGEYALTTEIISGG